MKMEKILILVLLITPFISGCNATTTRTKNPVFSTTTVSLQMNLNKLVSFESVNLDGKEITANGKANSELEIDITNGHNIPTDENKMTALAKEIAVTIKDALQDKNQYQSYKVLFIIKKENGGVTNRTWRGKIFNLEEL